MVDEFAEFGLWDLDRFSEPRYASKERNRPPFFLAASLLCSKLAVTFSKKLVGGDDDVSLGMGWLWVFGDGISSGDIDGTMLLKDIKDEDMGESVRKIKSLRPGAGLHGAVEGVFLSTSLR